ncbi:hypothetical protein SCNU_13613 [Gordonia neofelifaecis NRRL B-59395]|uniref:Uncharacterized protein n=1 Tax=Gordonia neofelifaecis NRRL B-59395 TaxID=644548 RepID=F1YL18_9ACTN|nr:hypothetical protein SCNU_13613 [Gordonia neofelifaecis NRRL B-59395]
MARRTIWSLAAIVVLTVRILATIATIFFTFAWLVAAVRSSLLNAWLWWAVGSVLAMAISWYLYSYLRVRYPSTSRRWEP